MSAISERRPSQKEGTASIEARAAVLRDNFLTGTGRSNELLKASPTKLTQMLQADKHEGDLNLITSAITFADHAHRGQMRRDGVTPHISHSLRVARRLADRGADTKLQVYAVLHDTKEDWDEALPEGRAGTNEEFKEEFYEHFRTWRIEEEQIEDMYKITDIMDKRHKDPHVYAQGIIDSQILVLKIYDRGVDNTQADLARLVKAINTKRTEDIDAQITQANKSRDKAIKMKKYLKYLPPHQEYAADDLEVTIRASEMLTNYPDIDMSKSTPRPREKGEIFSSHHEPK